ncbi:uncharacterized protein LOC143241651 [Tachypleus tridentatus]|uniref:uncharacterized protein LOC143241651 n=1 Tax=Tachypleus tridentatus TaxID=6853 RepID=UPI003FD1E040
MDLDQTQAIDLEFSDDEDKNEEEKQQVAYLLFPEQPGVDTSLKMPLFEGENIIGRDDKADVCLRNKALSKQHALVEIHNFSALICDLGSLNKTRKGKLFLKPHVRYNLETNEKLLFGNIRANFCWSEPLHYIHKDSSSDTESESMLPLQKEEENEEPHRELPQNQTGVSLETEKKDGGEEGNLQLTGNICKQVVRTESEVFGASDSVLATRRHPGEEDDWKGTDETTVIATTTQPFQPDGEDENDKIAMMMAETQPYEVDSTDKDNDETELMMAATQPYEVDSTDKDNDETELMMAATQPYEVDNIAKDNDETELMMAATQPYEVDSTDKDNDETELMMAATQPYEDNSGNEHKETTSQMAVVGESVKTFSKTEVMMEPTQMYLDDDDETDVEGSGANDEVLEMETQAFDEEINCKETKDGEVLTTGADHIKPLVFPIDGRDIGNTKNKSFNSGIDFLENSDDDDEILDTPPQASARPAEEEDRSDVNFQMNADVRDQKRRLRQSVSGGVEVEFEARLMNCTSLIEDSLSKQDETFTESILCPATQKKSGKDTEDDEDGFEARAQTPPYVEELTDVTTLVAETPPRLTESTDKPCFVVLPRLSRDDDGCIQVDGHLASLKKTDKGQVDVKPLKSKSFTNPENILSRDKNRDELNNERLDLVRESALVHDQSCTYFSRKKDTTSEKCYSESEMLGNDTSKEMLAAEEMMGKTDFVKIQRNIISEKAVRQDVTVEGKEEKSKSYDSSTLLENMGKETNETMEIRKPHSSSDEQEERIMGENKHQVITDVKVSNLSMKWNKRKQNLKLSKHKDVVFEEESHSLGGFSGCDRSKRSGCIKANKQNEEVHFKKMFYTNSEDIASLESGRRKSKTDIGEELENSRTADTNTKTLNTSLGSGKRRGRKSKTDIGEELENSRTANTNTETLNTSLESGKRHDRKSKTDVGEELENSRTANTNTETLNTSLGSGKRHDRKSKTDVGEELENSRTADTSTETLNTSLGSGKRHDRKSKTDVGEELENSRTADTSTETLNTSLGSGKRHGRKSKTDVGEELENSRTADTNTETLNTPLGSGKGVVGKVKLMLVRS